MNKKSFLLVLLLTACISIQAQTINKQWHFTGGDTGFDLVFAATTDQAGNVYSTGAFTGTTDFDPTSGVFNLSTVSNHSSGDGYVQKLDANGNLLWAVSFSSNIDKYEAGVDIALDANNNVYVSGYYYGDIKFTPNGNTYTSGNATKSRPFLMKLDSLGNMQWGMGWSNSATRDFRANDLKIDNAGDIYITGTFGGTVDFDPSSGSVMSYTSNSNEDIFIMKISSGGAVQKVRQIGAYGGTDDFNLMDLDHQGNIYLVGKFQDSIDFDNSSNVDYRIPVAVGGDFFITKMDTGFNHIWVKTLDVLSYENLVAVGKSGSVYYTGSFEGTIDLDPNIGVSNFSSSGNQDADLFVTKLNSNGNTAWIRTFGGTDKENLYDIHLSENEDVLLSGAFKGNIIFDGNSLITNAGGYDGFALRLDSAGNYVSDIIVGGTDDERMETARFIGSDAIIYGGYFGNTVDINPATPLQNITSNGSKDIYLVKAKTCGTSYDSLIADACGAYLVPSGAYTITQSGIYRDTLTSALGCDSVLTITATIYPSLSPSVIQTSNGLESIASGASTYQWMDCSTNQSIAGATDSVFMPVLNGQYAVIVSNANCTDTSACFTINNVGLPESQIAKATLLYPNPTSGRLSIECPTKINSVKVLDLSGRAVLQSNSDNKQLDITALNTGIYLVRLETDMGLVVKRVVKE